MKSADRPDADGPSAAGREEDDPRVLPLLWRLLRPYTRRIVGLSVLISGTAALGAVGPQFVRIAFDEVIPSGSLRLFGWFAAAFAGFYLIRALLGYAGMYLSFSFT